MKVLPSATYEVEDELFKTNGQMTFQIIALDCLCHVLQNHHYEIPDIIIRSELSKKKEKRDLTSCKMLIEGIPELTSCREINEMLTQIIAIHSLFKSFQNSDWRYCLFVTQLEIMESFGVSCEEKESHLMGKLSKLGFVGYDFQHFSFFFLKSFRFCFLPDVSKERHWRGIVIKFKELTLKLKPLSLDYSDRCRNICW